MKVKEVAAGPLLQYELTRLLKLLLVNDPISLLAGDTQKIKCVMNGVDVFVEVRLDKIGSVSMRYDTVDE